MSRICGKSKDQMAQLYINLVDRKNCVVATLNTQKIIDDFKYVVGLEIELTHISNDTYSVKLKTK